MAFQKEIPDIPTDARPIANPQTAPGAEAQAIQNIGEVAGNTVKDVQKSRLRGEISDISQVATTVGAAVEQGGSSVFNEEGDIEGEGLTPELQAQIARVKEQAGKRFSRIAASVAQGAIPQQAAALEAEAALKELVNQTPGFSREIRQQARDLLGYDPTGFALRQTLNIPSGSTRLTAQQKRIEEAKAVQNGLRGVGRNVPLNTILGNMALRDLGKINAEAADAELDLNNISVSQWAQRRFVERGPDLADTLAGIAEMGAQGGVQKPEQYANVVIQQREADLRELRRKISEQGGMSLDKQAALEEQITKMYDPLFQSIERNELGSILDTKLDVIGKLNKQYGAETAPMLTMLSDAYGPQIAGQLLEMMSNVADPEQFELLFQFEPGIKRLIEQGDLTQKEAGRGALNYIHKIFQGEPVSEEDTRFRRIAETFVTSQGNAETREKYVRSLGDVGAPIRAVSILASKVPRSRATDGEAEFFRQQFNTHVGQQAQESLPGNLVDIMAREIMDISPDNITEELHINDQGKIVVTGQFFGGVPSEMQTNSMKKMQPYLDAVQKGWAKDFNVDKDTFNTEIVRRVNDRIELLREAEEKKVEEKASSIFDFYNTNNFVYNWRKRQGDSETGTESPAPEELTPEEQTYRKNVLFPYIVRNEGRGNFNPTTNKHKVYVDDAGYRTIGYGHLVKEDENFDNGISEQEARQLLARDIQNAELGARNMFDDMFGDGEFDNLSPNAKAALIDVQFNVTGGISKFPKFSKAIFDGDTKKAIKEISERGYRATDGEFVHLQRRNADLIKTFLQGGIR